MLPSGLREELVRPGRLVHPRDLFRIAACDPVVKNIFSMWENGALGWDVMLLNVAVFQSVHLDELRCRHLESVQNALPGKPTAVAELMQLIGDLLKAVRGSSFNHGKLCIQAENMLQLLHSTHFFKEMSGAE